jgi:serine/threonine-protein kinase
MTDTKSPDGASPPSGTEGTALRFGQRLASGKPEQPAARKPVRSGPAAAPPTSMAQLLLGTVVADRYKLLERLGEGAMGWVFLAEHTEIGKKVAVKVLRPSLCRMPEAVRRFRREARAATQIGSRHIVDVTDFGMTPNGAVFFVMEHLEDGEDLGTALKKAGKMPWERVRNIVLQLCAALQAAHDADIIHRDVKPANFYRMRHDGNDDFIKVLDFGIARLATPKDSIVTQTGVVMGTPDFMAPEQAQGRHVDHRADIYSLGACAYALLTGRPPFVGGNEYEVIYKQLHEEPTPPSQLVAGIPDWFEAAVLRAMRKKPDERFQSMAELARALENPPARAASPSPSPNDAAARRATKVVPRSSAAPAWSPIVMVLGMLGLALLGALGYYLLFTG